MAGAKRGPKTELGKRQSAKNSTTHGARSESITGPNEQAHFDTFLKELIDFYKPQGPLEKLQLERIATCKAKLKSLYELEQAKLRLLIDQHQSDTNKYISDYPGLDPLVRGMMKELFLLEKFGFLNQICLPCQLTIEYLTDIVTEIDSFDGVLISDDDLRNYFPRLSSYLDNVESNEGALYVRLLGVGQQLEKIISDDDYHQAIKLIFSDRFEKVVTEPTPDEIEFDRQLELYQEQSRKRLGLKSKVIVKDPPVEFPNQEKLTSLFKAFKTLHKAYLMTKVKAKAVRSTIELHRRALSLPHEEADLLMRYQTSWERRLSTLIGEFMQLQKMRIMNESVTQELLEKPKARP